MERASELRVRIKQERRRGAGHGQHPFSPELRRRVVAFIHERRSDGAADHQIVAQLGLSQQTLHRWAGPRPQRNQRRPARGGLVPVAISRAVPSASPQVAVASAMIVAGPAQMRVAGLTLDELVELWRKLAC
jgi:transposase-like protein